MSITWNEVYDIIKEKADAPETFTATVPVKILREVVTYIDCLNIDNQCLQDELDNLRKENATRKITPSPYQPVGLRSLMKKGLRK